MDTRPILALTMGDVNGVGPEILVKALARPEPWQWCRPVMLGDLAAYQKALAQFPGAPEPVPLTSLNGLPEDTGSVGIIDAGFPAPQVRPGLLDPEAGRSAVEWIKAGVRLAMDHTVQGIVTCPINKECIQAAGCAYDGHTSLIAAMTNAPDYRMCLFAGNMRIVHITAHLSLRQALDAVKKDRIVRSIHIAHDALRRMGLPGPRIAVAGLNPHAGEAGLFGREELDEIAPAVAACCADGIESSGPYPPDTLFGRMRAGEFDLVIAMYHDQGHIPLKLIAMDEGVNVTLGIPIVRTSVDHGTAFDIAWKGRARENSLCAAIQLAAQFATQETRED
jgi:4-hydroxythreonine-4-phosphate dehydrogenase